MTFSQLLKHPSGFLPLLLSSTAVGTVLVHITRFGTAPQADEGAAAHIWQLLMAVQMTIIAFFAVRWLPASPRQGLYVLALQLVGVLAAMAPVFLLNW